MPVRGCIIKDELVTISNRQTNWTTLGLPPGAHDALSKTKNHHRSYQLRYQDNDDPDREAPKVFHARNSTTRHFRRFVRPSIDTHTTPNKNSFRFFDSWQRRLFEYPHPQLNPRLLQPLFIYPTTSGSRGKWFYLAFQQRPRMPECFAACPRNSQLPIRWVAAIITRVITNLSIITVPVSTIKSRVEEDLNNPRNSCVEEPRRILTN